jgi:hypothetical protein
MSVLEVSLRWGIRESWWSSVAVLRQGMPAMLQARRWAMKGF